MKSIGVKQLKARLYEYLRLVRTGETVLITDRDEVVAELRPAHRQSPAGLSVEERLQALADAGELTRPSLPKGDWTWKAKGLGLPPGTATRLLDECRRRTPADATFQLERSLHRAGAKAATPGGVSCGCWRWGARPRDGRQQ